MLLGAFDLNDLFQSGQLSSSPAEVIIHPDWNPSSRRYDADIACLMLDEDVPFTKYIRPICLPTSNMVAREGWIAGWGSSEDKTKEHENIPRQVKVPVHSNENCFLESQQFTQIASKRTICAGAKDKRGPCKGDSGNGLYMKFDNVFYLSGLVSASLTSIEGDCDVTNYALYTNIPKFLDWIKNPTEEMTSTRHPGSNLGGYHPVGQNVGGYQPVGQTSNLGGYQPVGQATKPNLGGYQPVGQTTRPNLGGYQPVGQTSNIGGYYGGRPTTPQTQSCGFMSTATGLIQGGKPAPRSLFPWTVAILVSIGNGNFQYFSTGTLISDRLIVTTGLSVATLNQQTQRYVARQTSDFRLLFGIENLNSHPQPQGAFQIDGVGEVILHPSIVHGSPRIANVGVLKLSQSVAFNSWISPACLPEADFDYADNEGKFAYAVGWGQSDNGADSDFKKYAQVKIQSEQTCQSYWSEYLQRGATSKFFCAGGNGRDSTCYRDQPLYLKNGNKWNLRALISIAWSAADGRCDLNYPVLYEDIGQFRTWLKDLINRQ